MDQQRIGAFIRRQRLAKRLTQRQLGEALGVSDRAVSKWERGLGCPDISLVAALAGCLGVEVRELLEGGGERTAIGRSMRSASWYVCPLCGNLIWSAGEAEVSCCGSSLIPQRPKKAPEGERLRVEPVEDERFITSDHPMTKEHYITLVALVDGERLTLVRQFPEWDLQVRLPGRGRGMLLWHCSRHGLFWQLL